MRIVLYFGSFNPIHMGHLVIANFMATRVDLDEVWLVVTPQSPLKAEHELISIHQRIQMVRLAITDHERLSASDVEFDLPAPHYTAKTMQYVREKYPEHVFSIIIGEDNWDALHLWNESESLLESHRFLVYPRRNLDASPPPPPTAERPAFSRNHPNVTFCAAPMISVSSTYLRRSILDHQDIRYLLPDKVLNYIGSNHLYE